MFWACGNSLMLKLCTSFVSTLHLCLATFLMTQKNYILRGHLWIKICGQFKSQGRKCLIELRYPIVGHPSKDAKHLQYLRRVWLSVNFEASRHFVPRMYNFVYSHFGTGTYPDAICEMDKHIIEICTHSYMWHVLFICVAYEIDFTYSVSEMDSTYMSRKDFPSDKHILEKCI